jgi:hypothetical protein
MSKSSTSFGTGKSGNPGGRKAPSRELRELAAAYTEESVHRLAAWMRSDNPKASVTAALALLDRAHGRPLQVTENKHEVSLGTLAENVISAQARLAEGRK